MAIGLILAAATVAVTTTGLICGLIKLEESERERIKKVFIRETDDEDTFDGHRKCGSTGFTHVYLYNKFNIENLTTTASFKIVLDLVKLDLAEEAKPEEIVFGCCHWCPKRDVISAVIEKTGANIQDVLEFEDKDGYNFLIIMFDVLVRHQIETGKDPTRTEMATEVEKSVEYLIELGEKQGLEIKTILEKTDKTGTTLLLKATIYSPKLALKLLKRGINAKSVDEKFMTPQFRFESLHRPMIAAGVNPFVLDYENDTQADYHNVSKKLISELNPGLTSDFFFSTTSLPCIDICDASCEQGLPDPWYYNNGPIYDFKREDRIGVGAEGAVFSGDFHGRDAAFKFVEVKNLKFIVDTGDVIKDLTRRLSEMKKLSETKGSNILPFYGHIRQQFSAEKVKILGLGTKITRYEVYITKQCEFNLAQVKSQSDFNVEKAKNIIDQLIDAQEQLQAAGVSHNDIKPGNILVDYDTNIGYKIYIGDFGQADQLGGTPGWTPPEFISPRVPGVSDMYSSGLVILFVLCEDDEVFYSIRDNFIDDNDAKQKWFLDLMNLPAIKLVQCMTEPDHTDRISLSELKSEWKKIRHSVKMISYGQLGSRRHNIYMKKQTYLTGQDSVTKLQKIMGRNLTMTKTKNAFTRTHLQGDTTLCWLYSITSSLHHSMFLKADFLPESMKSAAMNFLHGKHFHQNLRNEILFGLLPKSLQKGADQTNSVPHILDTLQYRGYLRKERGLERLPTIRRFMELIRINQNTPAHQFHVMRLDDFVKRNSNEKPLMIVNGHDKSSKSSFHHAVVLTECVLSNGLLTGKALKLKFKNSLEGTHLKGTIKLSDVHSNREVQLTQIKNKNKKITWTMDCYLTLFVTF